MPLMRRHLAIGFSSRRLLLTLMLASLQAGGKIIFNYLHGRTVFVLPHVLISRQMLWRSNFTRFTQPGILRRIEAQQLARFLDRFREELKTKRINAEATIHAQNKQ